MSETIGGIEGRLRNSGLSLHAKTWRDKHWKLQGILCIYRWCSTPFGKTHLGLNKHLIYQAENLTAVKMGGGQEASLQSLASEWKKSFFSPTEDRVGHVPMKAATASGSLESLEQRRVVSLCRFELHPRRLRRGWCSGCQWRTSWRKWSCETWSPCLPQGHGGRVLDRQLPRGVCCLGLLCWARQAGSVSGQAWSWQWKLIRQ